MGEPSTWMLGMSWRCLQGYLLWEPHKNMLTCISTRIRLYTSKQLLKRDPPAQTSARFKPP